MATKKNPSREESQARRKKLRLHGVIARDLGIHIVSGRYKPGFVLENEIEASERLKVSRTAYREAVRILSAKGLLHSRPKIGTRVAAPENWHLLDPDVLQWIFANNPDDTLLSNLFELRKIVEPQAAALAASRRTREHVKALREALKQMEVNTLTTEAGRDADREFHSILLRASGNAFLASLTSGIAAAVAWTTVFKHRKNRLSRDSIPDHQRVFAAIEAKDPQAAQQAMYELIDLAYADMTNVRKGKRQ